jgi:two-component system, NarL family, response regulator DesR
VSVDRLVGTYVHESESQGKGGKRMALILFVEYHAAFRQAASRVMGWEPDMEVVAQGGSVAEGRERMAEGGIDEAIVDIPLPDEGAPRMVRDLHEANPSIPVLVLTHLGDPAVHEEMLRAGAAEVLAKDVAFVEVLAAVRRLGHDDA